jgi:hypothetical protein
VLCATGAETIAAQNRPSRLWLERDTIRLAALIADDFESFTLIATAAASLFGAAETLAPRIATWFTSFRVA